MSHLFVFVFIFIILGGGSKKIAVIYVKEHSVCFPLTVLVSGLTFRSLIHFKFTIVCSIRECSSFIILHVVIQFSQDHFLKRLENPMDGEAQ